MTVDNKPLPAIPAKRYFTIGEVSELCGVKAYVLRYWEQEFTQLKPMKRRGNRRYYQHHEVLLIRRIRDLLYEQGFTISGARNQLTDAGGSHATPPVQAGEAFDADEFDDEAHDDAALEAMARDDLALIERAQRGVGEFAATAVQAPSHAQAQAHAVTSVAAGNAGVRAAALQARRSTPAVASAAPASPVTLSDAGQLRAELLAIRALLVS